MLFITGPLYSGKRTFSQKFNGTKRFEVQKLAAESTDLQALAEKLAAYDVVTATEVGGGVVPVEAAQRAAREKAGRLACLQLPMRLCQCGAQRAVQVHARVL